MKAAMTGSIKNRTARATRSLRSGTGLRERGADLGVVKDVSRRPRRWRRSGWPPSPAAARGTVWRALKAVLTNRTSRHTAAGTALKAQRNAPVNELRVLQYRRDLPAIPAARVNPTTVSGE